LLRSDDVSPEASRAERARMESEIRAADESLAETDERLQLNDRDLERALELAVDVQTFYLRSDEATKRSCNQAFFTKIYIGAESENPFADMTVSVTRTELTEPYVALLADDLADAVDAAIVTFTESAKRSGEPDDLDPEALAAVSNFERLAGEANVLRTRARFGSPCGAWTRLPAFGAAVGATSRRCRPKERVCGFVERVAPTRTLTGGVLSRPILIDVGETSTWVAWLISSHRTGSSASEYGKVSATSDSASSRLSMMSATSCVACSTIVGRGRARP